MFIVSYFFCSCKKVSRTWRKIICDDAAALNRCQKAEQVLKVGRSGRASTSHTQRISLKVLVNIYNVSKLHLYVRFLVLSILYFNVYGFFFRNQKTPWGNLTAGWPEMWLNPGWCYLAFRLWPPPAPRLPHPASGSTGEPQRPPRTARPPHSVRASATISR